MSMTDVQSNQRGSVGTNLHFTKTATDTSIGDLLTVSDILPDYQPFQIEMSAGQTGTLEIYAKLATPAGWALVDTVVLTAGQSVLKTYFEFPLWGFKVTAISGGNMKLWVRRDAV